MVRLCFALPYVSSDLAAFVPFLTNLSKHGPPYSLQHLLYLAIGSALRSPFCVIDDFSPIVGPHEGLSRLEKLVVNAMWMEDRQFIFFTSQNEISFRFPQDTEQLAILNVVRGYSHAFLRPQQAFPAEYMWFYPPRDICQHRP